MSAQIPPYENSQAAAGSALERSDTADNCYHYPVWRKWTVVAVTSWMTLAATFSSTSLFSAANEIASEYSTTAESINISSAGVLFAMGLSSFVWGPVGLVSHNAPEYYSNANICRLLARESHTSLAVLSSSSSQSEQPSRQICLCSWPCVSFRDSKEHTST